MRIYFICDLETSGLDPMEDRIVEVGWMYATPYLKRMSPTVSTPVRPVGAALQRIQSNPVVLDMHTKTGLLAILTDPASDLPELVAVEDEILSEFAELRQSHAEWVKDHPEDAGETVEIILTGKNPHFDRSFIDRYMPRLGRELSHRHFDENSAKYLLESTGKGISISGKVEHRAGFDVEQTYQTLRFMARTLKNVGTEDVSDDKVVVFRADGDEDFAPVDIEAELDEGLRKLVEED